MMNNSWEEETRRYMADTMVELQSVIKKVDELTARKEELEKEYKAYDIALKSHLKRAGKQNVLEHDMRGLLEVQQNHQERLKRIAEQNGGILKIGEATNKLYSMGLLKSKNRQRAYRIIYRIVLDMIEKGDFVKIAPATFKLQKGQPSLLNQ